MISEFPLWVFTTLTGMAAGAYVVAALFPAKEEKRPWLLGLIALALTVVGSLGALGHLGRPELVFGVLNNPAASLTLEGICAGIFAAAAAVDMVFGFAKKASARPVRFAGLALGCLLIAMESYAYIEVFGIPAWTGISTVALFVMSDIAAGACIWALLAGKRVAGAFGATCLILLALAAGATFWKHLDFSALGSNGAGLLLAGGIVTAAAAFAAAAGLAAKGKLPAGAVAAAMAALAIVGMAVARYGFYMASFL